jgi:hypothetical protein
MASRSGGSQAGAGVKSHACQVYTSIIRGSVMKLFFGPGKDRPIVICTDVRDCLPKDSSMAEAAKCWVAASISLNQLRMW